MKNVQILALKNLAATSVKAIGTLAISALLFSCQKEVSAVKSPAAAAASTQPVLSQPQLETSVKSVQLTQENANNIALHLSWSAFPCSAAGATNYTIEAALAGSRFNGWVPIGNSCTLSADFTTEQLNRQIRQLFVTGFAEDVTLRVRCNRADADALYSYGASLQVTTYQPITTYNNKQVFRVPGNFQNWQVGKAQTLVSAASNGEYEGYINFCSPFSQFLLVKGDLTWNPLTTFYYIGGNKFGFGGTMFPVTGGAGIYKMNVSTNSNTWTYTRIQSWNLYGTAISAGANTDLEMQFNGTDNTWEVTGNFLKGDFIFRANKSNDIVFGHNTGSDAGVPDYNGARIPVCAAGNYTIKLSLLTGGNYSYSIQRN